MELSLFDQVEDLLRAFAPDDLGDLRSRANRRGLKVWFDSDKPPAVHYEAQLLSRRHIDAQDGLALEIGLHSEHRDEAYNESVLVTLSDSEDDWRSLVGGEADAAPFFGADGWRRVSEAWIEPDLDDPELAMEIASRLVDYVCALEPALERFRAAADD